MNIAVETEFQGKMISKYFDSIVLLQSMSAQAWGCCPAPPPLPPGYQNYENTTFQ